MRWSGKWSSRAKYSKVNDLAPIFAHFLPALPSKACRFRSLMLKKSHAAVAAFWLEVESVCAFFSIFAKKQRRCVQSSRTENNFYYETRTCRAGLAPKVHFCIGRMRPYLYSKWI